jgi:hypothetical protein
MDQTVEMEKKQQTRASFTKYEWPSLRLPLAQKGRRQEKPTVGQVRLDHHHSSFYSPICTSAAQLSRRHLLRASAYLVDAVNE